MIMGLNNPSQRGFSHPGWARVDMAEERSHLHSEFIGALLHFVRQLLLLGHLGIGRRTLIGLGKID